MTAIPSQSKTARKTSLSNLPLNLLGWRAALFHGDPSVYARYRWLRKHLKSGSLHTLDAGYGNGALSFYASSIGNSVLAVNWDQGEHDKVTERIRKLNLNIALQIADFNSPEFHQSHLNAFDQIICFECIEHVQEDQQFVRNMAKMLKPGGQLLLTTPYKFHRLYFEESKTLGVPGGHVRFGYTHQEMRYLMGLAGLDITAEEYCTGFVTIQLANIYLRLNKLYPHLGWAATLPLRVFQILDRPVTRLLRYPYISIGVVGVKRAS